jgi:hypothetical protein
MPPLQPGGISKEEKEENYEKRSMKTLSRGTCNLSAGCRFGIPSGPTAVPQYFEIGFRFLFPFASLLERFQYNGTL